MRALLILLLLAGCAQAPVAASKLLSATTWTSSDASFGGFSGLEVSDDGRSMTTVTDRGIALVVATLERQDGIITGISNATRTQLPDPRGRIRQPCLSQQKAATKSTVSRPMPRGPQLCRNTPISPNCKATARLKPWPSGPTAHFIQFRNALVARPGRFRFTGF